MIYWRRRTDARRAGLALALRGRIGLLLQGAQDTPPVMSEGNWRVGVFLDDAASDSQAEQLGAVLSGQLGGPPAMLGPLIGEMLGVEKTSIRYSEDGRGHHVRIGEAIDMGVQDFVALEGQDPPRWPSPPPPSGCPGSPQVCTPHP